MSFPSGNVVVTPFVGAHDDNDGTVAPPRGSEFFEDVEGDYYDGLQNEDGEDRIAPGSAVLRPRQTWGGGHNGHRPRNADGGDRRLPPAHAPQRATATTTTTTDLLDHMEHALDERGMNGLLATLTRGDDEASGTAVAATVDDLLVSRHILNLLWATVARWQWSSLA